MIRVNVFSDSEGNTRKIELKGHAGYDDYGKDIVCASASALVLNMANSVEQFTDDGFDGNVEEELSLIHISGSKSNFPSEHMVPYQQRRHQSRVSPQTW